MTKIALAAYRFFQKRRAVFYLLLIGSFVLLALLASRMYYEEDISKLLPQTEENITEARWVEKECLPDYLEGTYPSIVEVFTCAGLL